MERVRSVTRIAARTRWILASFLIFALILTGCGGAAAPPAKPATPATPPPKTSIVVSLGVDPAMLDPFMDQGRGTLPDQMKSHIMDTLVTRDDDMKIIPSLATEWSNPDPNTWVFKIRPNVKFSNGEECDANAIKYAFDTLFSGKQGVSELVRGWFSPVKKVEAPDKSTLRITTSEPYPVLLAYLTMSPYIVPPKDYEARGLKTGPDSFGRKPIGTGPFKMKEWVPDKQLVLEANAQYWGTAPKLKQITYRPIAESGTRLAEFLAGGIDLISGLSIDNTKMVANNPNGKVAYAKTVGVRYVSLRTDKITDKKVRQALFYATDVKAIIDNLFGGYGDPMKWGSCITKVEFGYDPSIVPYPYDLEKAKALLAEAGYKDTNNDGILDKGGKPFTLGMVFVQGVAGDQEIAEAIAAQWKKVGVQVTLTRMERGAWRTVWFARDFPQETFLTSTSLQTFDADARLISMVHSPGKDTGAVSFYSNPTIDAKIQEARKTIDQKRRLQLYKEIMTQLREDAYQLSLFETVEFYAVNKNLKGWKPRADVFVNLSNASW
jgi:peptide/nickel transport system substrate-binding protein